MDILLRGATRAAYGAVRGGARTSPSRGRRLSAGGRRENRGGRGVGRVVVGEELPLACPPRESEVDEDRAREDGDDAGCVGPLVSLEERRLRGGDDLARVRGVLRCEVGGARVGELELALRAVDGLLPLRGTRD